MLHIVSFDVPYPPDYGGAVDVFYKIKSLAAAGCKIMLHCYEYGRGRQEELKKYCAEVHYYPRTTGLRGISFSTPYIVSSRKAPTLLQRLCDVDAPILFEGVHTTAFLNHPQLKDRWKAIRIHNVEHDYYAQLAKGRAGLLKKMYYRTEAALLKKYESALQAAQAFYAISAADHKYFKELYPKAVHEFIPAFHPYDEVAMPLGSSAYCLYHGNLSHPENRDAVMFLIKEVFPYIKMDVVIAGKKPPPEMEAAIRTLPNTRLIADPCEGEMAKLVAGAHIHVLPTFQQSGMKLKLLTALFGGRHVVVNRAMLYGTGLEGVCDIADTANDFIARINQLADVPFTLQDKQNRIDKLQHYTNGYNAGRLMRSIFNKQRN